MSLDRIEISVRGNVVTVLGARIDGRVIVVTGRLLRTATIHDEEFVDGGGLRDAAEFVSKLARSGLGADIFTFGDSIDTREPKYAYTFEWDNAAVASTSSFTNWWEHKVTQEVRKNVRRASKRGLSVRVCQFDDKLVGGIKEIYDETPTRQGRRFWHFGKDLETIKVENGTYLDRCEFIGAYFNDELVGFMKFVYVGKAAVIMQILSKVAHFDKRPMNALLAKAVEVCHEKGMRSLVYSKYTYGNKANSQLAEFKRRNGFEEMRFPKYYVPLTLKGRMALKLNLHKGLLETLPVGLLDLLLWIRSALLKMNRKVSPRHVGVWPVK